MKKIALLIITALGMSAFAQAQAPKLKNSIDSVSYAIGLNFAGGIAEGMEQMPGDKLNVDLIIDAFSSFLKNGPASTAMKQEDALPYIQTYMDKVNKIEGEKSKKEGEAFLEKNKTEKGVITLPSGLQYKVIKKGNGEIPKAESTVTVHYEGFLLDGTKFDSSIDRGEPTTFPVMGVISGWTEALQLMPKGSKWKLYLPYNLAYGEYGAGGAIPPYATLIFDVELIDVK